MASAAEGVNTDDIVVHTDTDTKPLDRGHV